MAKYGEAYLMMSKSVQNRSEDSHQEVNEDPEEEEKGVAEEVLPPSPEPPNVGVQAADAKQVPQASA